MRKTGYTCPIAVLPILIPFEDYGQEPDQEVLARYSNDGWTNLLFVGRIAPNKCQEDVIAAFLYRIIRKSTGNRYAGSSREIGRCWLAAFRNVWLSPTALHQLKYVDKKLMSLISMSLNGLGLRFSRAHIGKFFSHVATARSLNRRIRKDDVSFSLAQVGCNETLREELSVKYPKSERVMFLKEDYYRAEEDYWPDDEYDSSYSSTVVIS